MQEDSILVAKQTFFCVLDGKSVRVHAGQTIRVGHPLLEGREHYFKPLCVDYDVPPAPKVGRPRVPRTVRESGDS